MEENSTIHNLGSFLKTHGDSVLDGSSKLCLTTSCLSQLSRAFAMLITDIPESDSFKVLPCNAGPDIIQKLLFLRDILQKVVKLKLVTSSRTVESDIALSRFKSLKHLELQRVSPHLFSGIGSIVTQLETLGVHRCLSHVEPLLKLSGGAPWTSLTMLRLSNNFLTSFESHRLEETTNLKYLDLSHNRIQTLDISGLESLLCVDLSFNFISNVPTLHRKSSFLYLSYFSMRNNLLESLQGLEVLTALKVLDLGYNMISEFGVLKPLVNLLQLDKLTLEGNPISLHKDYLTSVSAHLAKTVILDGKFDVHSDRVAILSNDVVDIRSFCDEGSSYEAEASARARKSRQPVLGDLSVRVQDSRSVKSESFEKKVEMRREIDGDLWLITAANDLALPNAQSTPCEGKVRPQKRQAMLKENHQSDDSVVVSDVIKSFDTLTLTVEDVETQPRGALMTNSQTESAGDIVDEELGPPVLAGESDKEESPAILDETTTLADVDVSTFLSATENGTFIDESADVKSESPIDSVAESESSSVAYRLEQDGSVWMRLKDIQHQENEYDIEHSMDTVSKMNLKLVIFENDEDFKAAFTAHIVLGQNSFEGFVVVSSRYLYLTGLKVAQDGIFWRIPLDNVIRVTIQLGAQGLLLETKEHVETKWALVYVGDTNWCSQLAQHLSLHLPNAVIGRTEITHADLLASLRLEDYSLRSYSRGFWALIDDTGSLPVTKRYLSVAVAAEEIVVVRENHVGPEKAKFTEICVQSLTALSTVSVDESNLCIANLIFTDESTNQDQVWYFETGSVGSMLAFVESLKQPWQDIFDVDLPLRYIPPIENLT